MSQASSSKPSITLARLNDATLGSFALVPSSKTLEHLVRYLSTWSGSDKLFMIIQYAVKILVPILNFRARLQHRAGLRSEPVSKSADRLLQLGSVVGDSRMLWRIWGLLPIVQWLIALERNPQPTRKLLTIERLQGWSMLAYYPLEHFYYLCSHDIVPKSLPSLSSIFSSSSADSKLKSKLFSLNLDKVGMWSSRFWALYVVLQFAHLREDYWLLKARGKAVRKAKGTGDDAPEKEDLRQSWDAYWNEIVVNIGYLPLTVHWSLEKGLFNSEFWVGVFGLIAAIGSFRSGWKATALPSPTPSEASEDAVSGEVPPPSDVAFDAGFEVSMG